MGKNSGIILAFDFGTKNIGVAVGQRIIGTANPLSALKIKKGIPNWNKIHFLFREWEPEEIIIGLPLNMDGTEQPFTEKTRIFANEIQKFLGITVKLHDERLTTVEARIELFKFGGFHALKKGKIDSVAATIILKSYLHYSYHQTSK